MITDNYPHVSKRGLQKNMKGDLIMQSRSKIGVLGGDKRQLALCSLFAAKGYECALWGIDTKLSEGLENTVRCVDWKCALKGADAVILPLPLTTDGVRLNCTTATEKADIYIPRITEIIQTADRDSIFFAGKVPLNIKRFSDEHGIRLYDYYESEEFQIKNAVPTAEGAIAIAISSLDITLANARCAVVGYGRIGRTLAIRLKSLESNVTCIARSGKDLAWAECDGCNTIRLREYDPQNQNFDVIFNTVPQMIFNGEKLKNLSNNTLIIDLATAGCGVDTAEAEKIGLKTIKALSLPGKTSPFTAGKIIFESVFERLSEEGVL